MASIAAVFAGIRNLQAALLQRFLQQLGRSAIELPFHQRVEDMHDGHVHALLQQAVRRFESEQSAADDDGFAMRARCIEHRVHVLQIAERDDAGRSLPGTGSIDRIRAGGEQQAIVRRFDAAARTHDAAHAIDRDDRIARCAA